MELVPKSSQPTAVEFSACGAGVLACSDAGPIDLDSAI
jgi:hypothetical protein